MLTNKGVAFDVPLELPRPNSANKGWNMSGEYWTSTDSSGKHFLEIDAHLKSPEPLDADRSHYAGFLIGSETKVSNEWFWTGYEPSKLGKRESFYLHQAKDKGFSYIARRADTSRSAKPKRACSIINLSYDIAGKFKQAGKLKCPWTWAPKRKPTLSGTHLHWAGRRPYSIKLDRFLEYKLGKYNGYYINFHFFSANKGRGHWGTSKRVTLVLDNARGINKLENRLATIKRTPKKKDTTTSTISTTLSIAHRAKMREYETKIKFLAAENKELISQATDNEEKMTLLEK